MNKFTNTKQHQLLFSSLILLLLSFFTSKAQLSSYGFSQTTETYTPISGGVVLATATANTGTASIDDTIFSVSASAWPFVFQFNYTPVTQIKVSSNGFITFGAVSPSPTGSTTGYTPISATTAYDGCAAAMARNLNSYFISGNPSQTGELRYETIGTAPFRKFVVQYKNFRPSASGSTYGQVFNFQIRLCETNNNIEFVYGNFVAASSNTVQVGLRGANNTIFLNRNVVNATNTWSTSVAGTLNNSTCQYSNSPILIPPSGLVYRFGPPACPAPQNLKAINVTTSTADLTWTVTSGPGLFDLEYGLSGFTPGTGTVINNISGNIVSISNLTSQTAYQFYVKQNCTSAGNGYSLTSGPKNFSAGGPGENCITAPLVNVAPNSGSCSSTLITSGVSQNGPLATCSDQTGNVPDDDIWVRFVAPSNGKKLVISTTAGTYGDWVMQLWSDCSGNPTSVITCADDSGMIQMPKIRLCQDEYIGGNTYYLRMWTYSNTQTGNMTLCIYEDGECIIPPENDDCEFATRLNITPPQSCPGTQVTLNNKYATASGDPTACGSGSTVRDVWMVFNTGNIGDFNLNFGLGTATSLNASIFFECNGNEVMCFNNASGNHLITGLNPGADYLLRVWTNDTIGWGTFTVCLSDICIEPTASISGSTIICEGDTAHINITLGGGGPWNLTYSDGIMDHPVTVLTSPYVLDTAPNATTFYTLVNVSNATCTGTVSGNYLVNVVPRPQISSFTPASGAVGTQITINGNNFSNVNQVGINGVNGSGFSIVNSSQINFNIPPGSTSGLLSVSNLGCTVYSGSIFNVTAPTLNINMKVFIEGYYQGGVMPAVVDPVNKPNVCDTVELQLYEANPPYTFITSSKAELSIAGDVSFVFTSSISNQSYYLALRHRNSIETWSSAPVYIPAVGVLFNFTGSASSAYGGNMVNVGGSQRPISQYDINNVSKSLNAEEKIQHLK